MDPQRFDQLTRRIGRQASRRALVKTSAGGALALLGLGLARRGAGAVRGQEGDSCTTSGDCQTGLVCQGASRGLLGGLVAEGPYGPPGAATLFGPTSGTCRYRDHCAKSGQYCERNSDCCNGLNLVCQGHECQRR
ncbi:MAG: hypothetical protein IT338_04680 [Thermomicrobiales bacterium]|nr:hypothetical protein [Thermomicrobiales bacterium]